MTFDKIQVTNGVAYPHNPYFPYQCERASFYTCYEMPEPSICNGCKNAYHFNQWAKTQAIDAPGVKDGVYTIGVDVEIKTFGCCNVTADELPGCQCGYLTPEAKFCPHVMKAVRLITKSPLTDSQIERGLRTTGFIFPETVNEVEAYEKIIGDDTSLVQPPPFGDLFLNKSPLLPDGQYSVMRAGEESSHKYYDSMDQRYKDVHYAIDKAVESVGWQDFYYAVLKYQKELIESNYKLTGSV